MYYGEIRSYTELVTVDLGFKNNSSVLIRNTVPNKNNQRKNVPKKNNPCKSHRKRFSFSKWTFFRLKLEIFFPRPDNKIFVYWWHINFQRLNSNGSTLGWIWQYQWSCATFDFWLDSKKHFSIGFWFCEFSYRFLQLDKQKITTICDWNQFIFHYKFFYFRLILLYWNSILLDTIHLYIDTYHIDKEKNDKKSKYA